MSDGIRFNTSLNQHFNHTFCIHNHREQVDAVEMMIQRAIENDDSKSYRKRWLFRTNSQHTHLVIQRNKDSVSQLDPRFDWKPRQNHPRDLVGLSQSHPDFLGFEAWEWKCEGNKTRVKTRLTSSAIRKKKKTLFASESAAIYRGVLFQRWKAVI